jgi:hypothetical protein
VQAPIKYPTVRPPNLSLFRPLLRWHRFPAASAPAAGSISSSRAGVAELSSAWVYFIFFEEALALIEAPREIERGRPRHRQAAAPFCACAAARQRWRHSFDSSIRLAVA